MSTATTTAYWATTAHSHCRDANSCHPSRRSAHPDALPRGGAATRSRAVSAALTTKEAAFRASAQPAPTHATVTPDSARPSSREPLVPIRSSPLACCRRRAGTTSGTRPSIAGANRAVAVPATTASRHTAATGARPVSTMAARPP
ncbi:hypothetical protein QQY24_17335 [Streptomyces sp. TG1A-8]|nr:hypothetical protein [Streptomyces sp. TG1A-8]MDO0927089.1 hypothetical protein [Streptomyces sp. TG1A-8]